MNKRAAILINILLLTVGISSYTLVLGQTQESTSNNKIVTSITTSLIKDALDSAHNATIPQYVKLSESQINESLTVLPGWNVVHGKLQKTYKFVDFSTLFEFMYKVAEISQKLNHHPNMTSTWNSLTLDYDTWSLGHVISNLDVKSARYVEKTYQHGNYAGIES